jgi:endoribonuclease LACTB2
MREAKVLGALRGRGAAGAEPADLVPSAYDDTPKAIWGIAQMSLEAHLIKLVRDGLASSSAARSSRSATCSTAAGKSCFSP